MASLASAAISALLEFDEVDVQMIGADRVQYKILTTGLMPSIIELKTLIWSYLSPPVKRLEVTDIKVVERGVIADRYLVTVQGEIRPGIRGVLKDRFLGR
ncbi:MAG: hypothetical protein ACETVR_00380 [Candidatus Bathyarchaeia archaeon]